MIIKKLTGLFALCASFAFSPLQLRAGMSGEPLGRYDVADPSELAEQIRAEYAETGKAYNILCGTQHFEDMKITDFPDPDAIIDLNLIKRPAEAVVVRHAIKIIGTDMQIHATERLTEGDYILKTLYKKTLMVSRIVIGSLEGPLEFTLPRGIFFDAKLQEFLCGINRNALIQLYRDHHQLEVLRAVEHLMHDFLAQQNGFSKMPAQLNVYKELADRIRPALPEE